MQILKHSMNIANFGSQRCVFQILIFILMSSPLNFISGIQLQNPRGPLKDKCPVCTDIVKAFHDGLKKTAKSNYGGGNTKWEESRLGSYAFSEVRLTEVMEGLCDGGSECHHLLEEHEELVERFWFKEYAKQKDTDFFRWFCIDNIKVCCPNNTYGPSCQPCKGGLTRPCKDNGFCKGEGTREGTGECSCHSGYQGDRCDECTDGYYEESTNETHTQCLGCDSSCKQTCHKAGPKGCDECKEGYLESANWMADGCQEDGCEDINECENKPDLCGKNFYCQNTPGSFSCLQCDKECLGCTEQGTDKCIECRQGYHLVKERCTDIDECSKEEPVCTKEKERCTNRPGGFTCICEIGYEREGDRCLLRPKDGDDEKSDSEADLSQDDEKDEL